MTQQLISLETIRSVRFYPNGLVIQYRNGTTEWIEGYHPDLHEMLKDFVLPKVSDESADKDM